MSAAFHRVRALTAAYGSDAEPPTPSCSNRKESESSIEAIIDRETVTITTSPGGASVLCAVSDTGAGMPEDVLQRAAEPFFTAKGPQRLGLGLSSALGIMRQLGGQLDIHSEIDTGTRVTVRLRSYVS